MDVVTTPWRLYFQTDSHLPCIKQTESWMGLKLVWTLKQKENIFVLPGIEFHSSHTHSSHCDSHYPSMSQNTKPVCLRSRARDSYAVYCTLSIALFWVTTSVRNYHYSLRNNPEERISHPLRGGSLKSRTL